MKKFLKFLYLSGAFLCVGLGMVGVALPVLPTTPFLLLATFLFAKGSKRFHKWFLQTTLYQKHLEEFIKTKSMTLKKKWCILIPASAMLILAFSIAPIWHAKALIGVVMIMKYYYFFCKIKTIPATDV